MSHPNTMVQKKEVIVALLTVGIQPIVCKTKMCASNEIG